MALGTINDQQAVVLWSVRHGLAFVLHWWKRWNDVSLYAQQKKVNSKYIFPLSATGERFSPRRNAWEAISNMHSRRSTHEVCQVDGVLYAVGGNDGSSSLNSVEVKLNPQPLHYCSPSTGT